MVEILKQNQYAPMLVEQQVAIIYAGINGYLDDIPLEKVGDFEKGFLEYLDANSRELLDEIRTSGKLDDKTETQLKKSIDNFKKGFTA